MIFFVYIIKQNMISGRFTNAGLGMNFSFKITKIYIAIFQCVK